MRPHTRALLDLADLAMMNAAPKHPAPAGMRYSDRPTDWRSRAFGAVGASTLFAIAIGASLLTWQTAYRVAKPAEALVVQLAPLAAPPEPSADVAEGPRQIERKQQKAQKKYPEPTLPAIVRTMPAPPKAPEAMQQQPAAEAVPQTSAPKPITAPPAPQASSNIERTWEALLLGHLQKYRRYPAAARARGEQGTVYVRFRMDRGGSVLSCDIVQSSGSALLDRAALDTLRRAQPLPRIPDDRPAEIELSIPVEFFVNE